MVGYYNYDTIDALCPEGVYVEDTHRHATVGPITLLAHSPLPWSRHGQGGCRQRYIFLCNSEPRTSIPAAAAAAALHH